MDLLLFFFAGFLAISAAAGGADAVQYTVTNNALSTPGGQRFQSEIGQAYSEQVLAAASSFVWTIFQQAPADRKAIDQVLLSVEVMNGIAETRGNAISLSAAYVANLTGDVRKQVTQVLYHEVTHVWQWNGQGTTPVGLIEGIASYVEMRAGYLPWGNPGKGDRWDQGYDVTALFLDYCGSLRSSFVADLNRLMKGAYSDGIFQQLLGKTVDQLWADYKAKYGG